MPSPVSPGDDKKWAALSKEDRRRLRVLTLPAEHLVEVLRGARTVGGIPEDAMIVGFSPHARFSTNEYVFMLWSASFGPVPEAAPIPDL